MVSTRARSRRCLPRSALESSVPAAWRILRLNTFSRSSAALRVSSSTGRSFSSAAFIASRSQLRRAAHEPGGQGQLVRSEPHRLLGDLVVHAFHLVEDAAHLHHRAPLLDVALAVAHARLGRLLGDRLVREHADPDLPAALDEAGHGDAARLDLARGEPPRLEHLEAVVAEGEIALAISLALVAALHLLAVLGARWLKHLVSPYCTGVGVAAEDRAGAGRAGRGVAFSAAAPSGSTSPRKIQTLQPIFP